MQIGPDAVHKIVMEILSGTGITKKDKIVIVDLNPCVNGQWMQSTHDMQKRWANGEDIPFISYAGFDVEDGGHITKTANDDMLRLLIQEWWATHPEAGPAEPSEPLAAVPRPILTLMSWGTSGPMVSDDVKTKFSDDSEYFGPWSSKLKDVQTALAVVAVMDEATQRPLNRPPGSADDTVKPDYANNPPAPMDKIDLEEDPTFKMDDVSPLPHSACGYVCVYVCVYICMYVCMCVCVCIVCMCVCVHIEVYVLVCVSLYVYVCTYCVSVYTYIYI
jgi:hypothetical protein